jgi:hypothetical protein
MRLPEGSATPAKVAGKTFAFPANHRKLESISLVESDGGVTLVAKVNGTEQRVACGRGSWTKGRTAWGTQPEQPVAAAGAWTADDTFTARLCFYETPFAHTIRLKFAEDEVKFESEANVGFGPVKAAPLTGTAK